MKIINISALLICIGFSVFSQIKIQVTDAIQNIGGAGNNCLVATIYELSASDVEKGWKKELEMFSPVKVSGKGGEIFAYNAKSVSIGDSAFDIYARAEEGNTNEVRLIVAFKLDGTYLSPSKGNQYKAAEKIIYDFAVRMTKQGVQEKMKNAQKELEKRQKKLDQLIRDKSHLEQDIEKYKSQVMQAEGNIVRAKEEIQNNVKMQEEAKKKIEEQQNAVKLVEEQGNKIE